MWYFFHFPLKLLDRFDEIKTKVINEFPKVFLARLIIMDLIRKILNEKKNTRYFTNQSANRINACSHDKETTYTYATSIPN